ncbi:hypothetical protein BaRGS_00031412 [Batillaria attramentaria]|uniref:Uncharacterized protein n=1 Tax=Batillaria attramentaria TaxID=370345 RepID=A0ABD0JRY8_9CAEN
MGFHTMYNHQIFCKDRSEGCNIMTKNSPTGVESIMYSSEERRCYHTSLNTLQPSASASLQQERTQHLYAVSLRELSSRASVRRAPDMDVI